MPSPHREEHDEHLQRYLRTGVKKVIGSRCEVVGRRKDGGAVSLDIHVSELRLGERRLFTGIVRDISEQKRAEQKLHATLDELERFNRAAVGRELKMIELKREINDLLHECGREQRYRIPDSEGVDVERSVEVES
jgi:hypothetical protein